LKVLDWIKSSQYYQNYQTKKAHKNGLSEASSPSWTMSGLVIFKFRQEKIKALNL